MLCDASFSKMCDRAAFSCLGAMNGISFMPATPLLFLVLTKFKESERLT